jgi:predicted dehydrogenase/acetyltransferase-like isoleucine patch superfamily enzyme
MAVNVAVLGCGSWGKNLVRNFHQLGALAAVHDPDLTVAAAAAASYDVPARSVDEILADASIEAVAIAAPAKLHFELAAAALEAGKHVFVEKPIALTLDDAERMRRLAEQRGKILMVGHLLQYHPVFIKLKEMVSTGGIGRLQYLYSNRLNLGKLRRDENALWSLAPHDVSMILSLVGEEPASVVTVGGAYLHKTVADVTTTHLAFPNGVQAHIFVSWLHPFKEQKLVVVGDRAMAVFDDGLPWADKLQLFEHSIAWTNGIPVPSRSEGRSIEVAQDEPLRLECLHFLESAEHNRSPRTDGAEGLRVLRVLNAAQRSMEARQFVEPAGLSSPPDRFPGVAIHESTYVDDPVEIGAGTRIWHFSHILGGTRIGRNASIGQNVAIGPDVEIGNNCKIQNNVSIYKGVTLEDGVFCGPSSVFTNVNNPRAEIERKSEFRKTLVKRGATIGANATILCGHTLGEYCFVAAGAVVTKDVPAHALVTGNPARITGWMSAAGLKLGPDLVCPATGKRYALDKKLSVLTEA